MPAATTLQIAAAHHVRRILPRRRRQSGALVKFIAIGGDHQPVMGLGTPGNKQQAHTFLACLRVTTSKRECIAGKGRWRYESYAL